MNIIFMGTPDFAVPSLEILIENKFTVSAVVTAPDKPRGRGQQVNVTPVKQAALKYSLPVLQPESLKDPDFINRLTALKPDLIVVVAFRILPREVYSVPAYGSFNLHASLLPKYRGAAPINWAIINGEKESGVTTFFLQDKVDTGNIILQHRIPITDAMTAGELYSRLSDIGASTVLETVRMIERGEVQPTQQDDALASPAPKIFKETCRIDWNRSSEEIRNFVRGLSPYPSAWTMLNGKGMKIFEVRKTEYRIQKTESGTFSSHDGRRLFVKTKDDWLEIFDLQLEGKKRMPAEDFLRGYRLTGPERFE
ncbi:MAG: methionyl-tRNA formyltransferase [Bacteroidota bacterium]